LTVEHCVIHNWNWNSKTTTEITLLLADTLALESTSQFIMKK